MHLLRRRLSILLIAPLATLSAACATPQPAPAETSSLYLCDGGQEFTVERDGASASVAIDGREYLLERRRSSLGERYGAPDASLILDGDSAVFIAEDRLDLDGCMSTEHWAGSARHSG